MMSVDLVELALSHAVKIDKYLEVLSNEYNIKIKGFQSKLRTRARNLPSLVMNAGLVPALLFYLSKTDENHYALVCRGFGCGGQVKSLEKLKDNEFAYAAITIAVLLALRSIGVIGGDINISDIRGAIEALMKLRNKEKDKKKTNSDNKSIPVELYAVATLEEYLVSLKRAAEALWEEDEKQ